MSLIAFAAGVLTILNPCVLPILPVITASAMAQSRWAPGVLILGVTVSFSIAGFALLYLGSMLGGGEVLSKVAGAILVLSGLILIIPKLQGLFATAAAPISDFAGGALQKIGGNGLTGQFCVGALLGGVWTPCVGPTLGAAISAASMGENLVAAWSSFAFFSLGVFLSLTVLAYGLRGFLSSRKGAVSFAAGRYKTVFGAAIIFIGLLLATGLMQVLEAQLLRITPDFILRLTTSI